MTTPPAAEKPTGPGRVTGRFVPHRPKVWQRAVARIFWVLEHLLVASMRIEVVDTHGSLRGKVTEPVVFCLWHNRLALSMLAVRLWINHCDPPRRLAALVSASRDGALLSAALKNFGVQEVRGSSSRRGSQAVRELNTWIERGYDAAITPDGPRGPRYTVQPGAIRLAQMTGAVIIPFSWESNRFFRLGSWDRFRIPCPFTRCILTFGEPLRIPRDLTDDGAQSMRDELERRLNAP